MAGRAVVLIDAQVIEGDAGKTGRIVAVAGRAIQGRRHVIEGFSDTDVSVMAQGTVAGIDEQVIEGRIGKFGGGMAIGAILIARIGRQVIHELADADHVVVTQRAVIHDARMIVGAAFEGAGGMAHRAIFEGWHVVQRRAACGNPMTRSAVVDDATMIENGAGESHGVMANAAIGVSGWVSEGLPERVDAVVVIVASRTRLRDRVDDGMVENAAEAEAGNGMAYTAVDGRSRMADRLPRNQPDAVARVAPIVDNVRPGVVGVGRQEAHGRMAGTALRFGDDMAFGLADRHAAIVAPGAGSGNVGVIEAAVR